jgi:hypothetical protein
LRNFEVIYEGNIQKLFAMLSLKLQLYNFSSQQVKKVKEKWTEVAREFLKINNPTVQPEDLINRKLIEYAHKTPSRQAL